MTLTKVQHRVLRMLKGADYEYVRSASGNYYHVRHLPGNLYIDYRTARVLRDKGLIEIENGRLLLTEEGRKELTR